MYRCFTFSCDRPPTPSPLYFTCVRQLGQEIVPRGCFIGPVLMFHVHFSFLAMGQALCSSRTCTVTPFMALGQSKDPREMRGDRVSLRLSSDVAMCMHLLLETIRKSIGVTGTQLFFSNLLTSSQPRRSVEQRSNARLHKQEGGPAKGIGAWPFPSTPNRMATQGSREPHINPRPKGHVRQQGKRKGSGIRLLAEASRKRLAQGGLPSH